mmetsp:Transcript_2180/g.7531  ORF Transcript_2180/g.7531 Transcript_2180/m.7531 type:complete len:102 (-) Transcript_2180:453-758(-)
MSSSCSFVREAPPWLCRAVPMAVGGGSREQDELASTCADTFQVREIAFTKHYKALKVIGSGALGTVSRTECVKTGALRAVNSNTLDKIGSSAPEVQILPRL